MTLRQQVDAVLTSPPYPGVYDYLSFARKVRAGSGTASKLVGDVGAGSIPGTGECDFYESDVKNIGGDTHTGKQCGVSGSEGYFNTQVPADRAWPKAWTFGEIGARRSLRSDPHGFKDSWQNEQEGWLRVVAASLKPGGRAAVMVGDGANIDTQGKYFPIITFH